MAAGRPAGERCPMPFTISVITASGSSGTSIRSAIASGDSKWRANCSLASARSSGGQTTFSFRAATSKSRAKACSIASRAVMTSQCSHGGRPRHPRLLEFDNGRHPSYAPHMRRALAVSLLALAVAAPRWGSADDASDKAAARAEVAATRAEEAAARSEAAAKRVEEAARRLERLFDALDRETSGHRAQ